LLTAVADRLRSLRARLVLTFILVALAGGAAGAGANYLAARNAILSDGQQQTLIRTRDQLTLLARDLQFPLDQAALERIRIGVADKVPVTSLLVVYRDLQSPAADSYLAPSAQLRQRVENDRLTWQRLRIQGTPFLVFGIPVDTTDGHFTGLQVYGMSPLDQQETSIAKLGWSTARTTAIAVTFAVLLALIAARSVLRPVRDLQRGARRLAAGELHTRLPTRGSDELADLVLTFNNAAATLEENVERLRRMEAQARRFVADVSHELRTPLTAMTAVTDTLDEEVARLPGDAGTAARVISTETRRLAQLVENLIEISRFDAGRAVLQLDEVDLSTAVAATLAARGWSERVDTDLPAGITAIVDRRRLDVILANLVGNALRYGEAPVTVTVRTDASAASGDWVTVTVTDRGPGLAPEVAPHVFDRFFKADASRTRSEGSGLGLAIAWENARLHDGMIEAANQPGGGAQFRLRLPRRPGSGGSR
jgi:two-component system sensor histidine kinase MtrB